MDRSIIILLFLSIFAICFNCDSNVFSIGGKCINSTVLSDFDPIKFQGFWYEAMRFPNIYEGDFDDTTCVKNKFTFVNSSRMIFNATAYKTLLGEDVKFDGELTQIKSSEPNKYNVKFNLDFFTLSTVQLEGKFDIMDTDYTTYALIYSCSPYKVFVLNFKTEAVWLLTRTKQALPELTLKKIKAQLDAKKLNSTQLQIIDQDCD